MKIFSFDGKKRIIDNFDETFSPMYLGQKPAAYESEDGENEENASPEEKQIEK